MEESIRQFTLVILVFFDYTDEHGQKYKQGDRALRTADRTTGYVPGRAGVKRGIILCILMAALCFCTRTKSEAAAARWPVAPGGMLNSSGSLQVDAAALSEGYFQASVQNASGKKYKMRVTKDGQKLTYDLNPNGDFEIFPLQLGDGYYEISLYRNIQGKEYAAAGTVGVNVSLSDSEVCFLYPNQYVMYTPETEAVGEAEALCSSLTEKQAYEKVCEFMKSGFVYDYVKALTVKAGTLPDIDDCFSKKMGVCQDLSAIMCCMLRTQGVPARLVIGYADDYYHAWVEMKLDGKDYFFDPTAAINGIGKVKTYSVERWY